jgi:hypothetical protein
MDNIEQLSISMLIENDISKINIIERRSILHWIPDNTVSNCFNCQSEFSIINRKHHCRYCGKIFCNICSNFFIDIPQQSRINSVIKKLNPFDWKTYIYNSSQERVCKSCFLKIQEWNEMNRLYSIFSLLPLDIKDYLNIQLVSKTWYKISKYHLSHIREIQYRFSDNIWSKYELQMLEWNKYLFVAHSNWIIQYILSIDWNNNQIDYDFKINIINFISIKSRLTNCKILMCSRNCSHSLKFEDYIIIINKSYTFYPLIKWIIDGLNKINITDKEFIITLYIFINTIKNNINNIEIFNEYQTFLLNKCKISIQIANKLFWLLTNNINIPLFKEFRNKLINQLDKNIYNQFQYGYDFTNNIIHILTLHKERRISAIKEFINEMRTQKFYLPIDITKSFYGIDTNKIYIIQSKTQPIILPCIYNQNEIYNIMLKKENVTNEEIIMNIINFIDLILKNEENIDFNIITYNIQPISNDYGYIQFVPNSTTLFKIKDECNFTLQNFVLENNPNISISEFRNRFSKSCAAFCVISYVLGIGDRHLDNIMITSNGALFHIDYAYVLGKDPKPITNSIRITPDMIDALGGISSIHFNQFKQWCGIIYNCIRRHMNLFYNMLLLLEDDYFTKEYIKKYVIERFIPGENYKDAHNQFIKILEQSYDSYKNNIIDYFHKQYKTTSSHSLEKESITQWVKSNVTKWIPKII